MNDISSDDIFLLKQRLAEQEALIHAPAGKAEQPGARNRPSAGAAG
ncbi:hypothetical protein F3J64_20665 [Escherichia coli]|nr:hypothetical protein F3J64_20665 [Escherichia coli]UFZ35271.1 hypothetical protein E8R56_20665 [Escherichia coli]